MNGKDWLSESIFPNRLSRRDLALLNSSSLLKIKPITNFTGRRIAEGPFRREIDLCIEISFVVGLL